LEGCIIYDYYLSKRRRCNRRYCSVNNTAAAHATMDAIGRIRYMAPTTVNKTSDHAWLAAWHASDCVKWSVPLAYPWARNGEVWLLISQVTRASGKDRTSTVTDSNRMPSIDQHRIDFTDIGHVCCAPEVA